jgi:xanthine dehydrogenase large subunit
MNKPVSLANEPSRQGAAGRAFTHESAHLHVSGEATYIDDIPELQGTLYAALGLSQQAHARILSMDLSDVLAAPGVVAVLTAADIPGANDCGPIVHDDPILAEGVVQYIGQPIFTVIADTYHAARRAARLGKIEYEALPAILTPEQAKQQGAFLFPPLHLRRGEAEQAIGGAGHRLKGKFSIGGQEQFYLEGQISYAMPKEDNGMHVLCSTQHPTEMQNLISHCLNLPNHQVKVEIRRMGGAFGGKESQSGLFACVAALAAARLKRPVKVRLDRDDDMLITGKRHCFNYDYEAGFEPDGLIRGVTVEMCSRGGFSTDLSGPVATRALCHFDNAYFLSDVDIRSMAGKTNTQSNTAFRGFGGPQGAIAIEYIIDDIARELGLDPLDVRKRNFYGKLERNVTPYGMTVEDNVIHELVAELEQTSDYRARRQAVLAFNQDNEVIKKGLALTPLKFGISFNVVHFNQAGALVHIYTDGSVLVNHGGTEMGQGLNTKIAQIVANELGIDLSWVRSTATDTSKVPNTSATAASSGTDLNGKAAQDAARQIKVRLSRMLVDRYGGTLDDVGYANNQASLHEHRLSWPDLVRTAYESRVQLWSDGFYATPKLNWDRETLKGRPFFYFSYGAAVSEVQIDCLTGEWKLLRVDLLHDAGKSINPALDIGQVEGAFIQAMGWLTMEELWWNKAGKLMTHAPSTYKIPAVNDCPDDFRVKLFDNRNAEDTIFRSKAVGEPPMLLAFSVFFALRDAIASVAQYKLNPPLNGPATSERILQAITAIRGTERCSQDTPAH